MTTTGFASTDTEAWPVSLKVLLVILMFVGGCAGSTGSGIKRTWESNWRVGST